MPDLDWPALCVGLIVAFYWGRVIKLVLKTRRLTGRAANFFPPETLGRILRIIWYPNVAAWVLLPLIMAFVFVPPPKFWHILPLEIAAVVLAFVVLYLTMICWRKMGKDWRMGIDPNEKNTLIITGPYALVRHPIYALQCLLAVLTFVAVPHLLIAIVALVQIVLLQWEARREEKHMASVHGETYINYMRQVGRFIPRGVYRAA
jgi:protein-S-isoprenylcysteine O-methyltransferase Ste14